MSRASSMLAGVSRWEILLRQQQAVVMGKMRFFSLLYTCARRGDRPSGGHVVPRHSGLLRWPGRRAVGPRATVPGPQAFPSSRAIPPPLVRIRLGSPHLVGVGDGTSSITTSQVSVAENALGFSKTGGSDTGGGEGQLRRQHTGFTSECSQVWN